MMIKNFKRIKRKKNIRSIGERKRICVVRTNKYFNFLCIDDSINKIIFSYSTKNMKNNMYYDKKISNNFSTFFTNYFKNTKDIGSTTKEQKEEIEKLCSDANKKFKTTLPTKMKFESSVEFQKYINDFIVKSHEKQSSNNKKENDQYRFQDNFCIFSTLTYFVYKLKNSFNVKDYIFDSNGYYYTGKIKIISNLLKIFFQNEFISSNHKN